MTLALAHIKRVLREADIEGYIEYHGAPDNEYDSEAEEIARVLAARPQASWTSDDVLVSIIPIWAQFFNLDEEDMAKRMPFLRRAIAALLSLES